MATPQHSPTIARKLEAAKRLSKTAWNFDVTAGDLPDFLLSRLTAAELAAVVDFGEQQVRLDAQRRAMEGFEGW